MDMAPNDVQVVIICAVPTQVVEAAGCAKSEKLTITEPIDDLKLLLPVPRSDEAIYSCAHIAKMYELESAALVDARRKLADVRAGVKGSEDDDAAELERLIQELIDEASKETTGTTPISRSAGRSANVVWHPLFSVGISVLMSLLVRRLS